MSKGLDILNGRNWDIKSGDDKLPILECYDCGGLFAESVTENSEAGDYVSCPDCGKRHGYITEE